MSEVIETGRWKSVATALILGFICVVFILEFGQGSRGCDVRETGAGFAADVYGKSISVGDFRAAQLLSGVERYPAEMARQQRLKEKVLDALIERELLVRVAGELGFETNAREVMGKLANESIIYMPALSEAPDVLPGGPRPVDFKDDNGDFSAENAKRFIRNYLRRSVEEFANEQAAEMLAERVRDTVRASVTVSPNEIWDAYVREHENATIEYFRFSPNAYRDTLAIADADLTTWMAAHTTEINAEFDRTRHRYTNLEKQVRARHILIKVASDATEEQKTAARAKVDGLLARARAGEDFAALAREFSEDEGSARKGGDLGYNPRGRMVAPFDEAQFALAPGAISDVVESNFGFHVIKVEAVREGNVPEAEAKREIAERLYRDERAKTLAREEADRALAGVRSGTTFEALDEQLRRCGSVAPCDAPAAAEGTELRDPFTPHIETSRAFGRGDQPIAGVGDSGAIARAAYALTMASPLHGEVMPLGDDFVIFRLKEINQADREGLTAEDRQRIRDGMLLAKQQEALIAYVRALREAARASGDLRINEAVISYGTTEDEAEEGAN